MNNHDGASCLLLTVHVDLSETQTPGFMFFSFFHHVNQTETLPELCWINHRDCSTASLTARHTHNTGDTNI